MSLPLSDLVQVDIAVSPTLDPLAGFGEELFLTNDPKDLEILSFVERLRKFGSLKEVQDAWVTYPTSDVVVAATSFYSQKPQPKDFTVGVMTPAATAATLLGGAHVELEVFQAMTAAEMNITVDGVELVVTNLDLTASTSLADVADKVTAVLGVNASKAFTSKASCKYSQGRFVITSLTTGANSTIAPVADVQSVENNNLGLALGVTGTTASGWADGIGAPETVSAALAACENISETFVALVTHKNLRDKAEHISGVNGAAAWCQANDKLFMNTTNDLRIFGSKASQEATEAYKVKQQSFGNTITTFGKDPTQYPSASLFGRIATVNYEGTNTCITLMFKKLPGITALNLTKAQKKAMDSLNVGGFMDFGGNLMYSSGRMADNGWMDTVHGLMWLKDRIRKGVFNLMYGTTTKIPYTDTGVNMVVQKVTTALEQGVANGLIAPGRTPEGEFLPTGYKIIAKSTLEVAAEDKSNRIYRGITFIAVGAGALQGAVISGSFSE